MNTSKLDEIAMWVFIACIFTIFGCSIAMLWVPEAVIGLLVKITGTSIIVGLMAWAIGVLERKVQR